MIGNGCKVGYNISSPANWVEVPDIVDLGFPIRRADRVEKTVHSPTRLKRFEPGLEDVEDPFFVVLQNLSDPGQKALRTLKDQRAKVWWRYEAPTNDTVTEFVGFEFEGRIASFEPGVPKEGEQTTRYTLMFDGDDIYEDAAAGASEIS